MPEQREFYNIEGLWADAKRTDIQMGTITDIKQALRKAQALKISYAARKAVKN